MHHSIPAYARTLALLIACACVSCVTAQCTSPIYCVGPLLDAVARAGIYVNDSGEFVDMPSKFPPEVVLENFGKLPANATYKELQLFLDANFLPPGSDLVSLVPPDWTGNPPFLKQLNDSNLLKFGSDINEIWNHLIRKWNTTLTCPTCYSHIDVPYPFSIAGSSFWEYYYWDTYWVLEGLLASGMYNTSKGIILNFVYLVETYGFVPNGGRVYYLNRSQPPVLAQMAQRYYDTTGDKEFIATILPVLDQEYQFWIVNRSVAFSGYNTDLHLLNRYNVNNSLPRPEAYMDDVSLAEGLNDVQRAELFAQIASTCESGWDFSSRWMANKTNMATLQTNQIIPVDLNSILYANEITLAGFHGMMNDEKLQAYYIRNSKKRYAAIQTFLFDSTTSQWNDYHFVNKSFQTDFYTSNFVPLWAGAFDPSNTTFVEAILNQIEEVLVYPAGVPTSLFPSGQQWDFPNGWAPLQYFVIHGLEKIANSSSVSPRNVARAATLSLTLAQKWVATNYCGWLRSGKMFEKYDVTHVGRPGGGGQYTVQWGFGWTNGVILDIFVKYGPQLMPINCP